MSAHLRRPLPFPLVLAAAVLLAVLASISPAGDLIRTLWDIMAATISGWIGA